MPTARPLKTLSLPVRSSTLLQTQFSPLCPASPSTADPITSWIFTLARQQFNAFRLPSFPFHQHQPSALLWSGPGAQPSTVPSGDSGRDATCAPHPSQLPGGPTRYSGLGLMSGSPVQPSSRHPAKYQPSQAGGKTNFQQHSLGLYRPCIPSQASQKLRTPRAPASQQVVGQQQPITAPASPAP